MNRLAVALVGALVVTAVPAAAQPPATLVGTAATVVSLHTNHDLAFNDKAGVYLRVWGHPLLWGAFVNANGAMIGAPFLIAADGPLSNALPRVAYSQGSAADDVFWVTFICEFPGRRITFSRLVRYDPSRPNFHWLGPVQPLAVEAVAGPIQKPGGIAFDPFRRQFFATWEGIVAGDWEAMGQVWQLSGPATAPVISPASAPLAISASPNAQGAPDVAFDWQHNKYLVVYMGEHPQAASLNGTWARTVTFDAALNPSYSAPIEVSSGGGPIEQGVLYAPEADKFLAYWTGIYGGSRDLVGSLIDHNGVVPGIFTIMGTGSGEGAGDAAYNPSTRSIFVAAQRDQTRFVQGVMLTGAGAFVAGDPYFQASAVVPPPGQIESLTPQVAAAPGGRFGVSYLNAFQFGYVDVMQAALASTPGPTPGAPPAPPCAIQPGVSSINLSGATQSQSIAVTASTADCPWTATSSVNWITITAGASGAGPGNTTFAVSRNMTGAIRMGTVAVGSAGVTIVQAHSIGNAAVHDLSGDRASDLMWHHDTTGNIAVWTLAGSTVTSTYMLTTGGIDTNWEVVGTGDLDGDGVADVIWRHRPTGGLASWLVRGGQIYSTGYLWENGSPAGESDPGWEVRAVGDLDGNGKSDIVWQHVSGVLAVWFMNGTTVQSRQVFSLFVSDSNWKIAGAGDVNMDGKADILWQNDVTGELGAWLMNGNEVLRTSMLSISGVSDTNWKVKGVGDTNGDGSADILWQNRATGQLAVWYLINSNVVATRWLSISRVTDLNWHVAGPG